MRRLCAAALLSLVGLLPACRRVPELLPVDLVDELQAGRAQIEGPGIETLISALDAAALRSEHGAELTRLDPLKPEDLRLLPAEWREPVAAGTIGALQSRIPFPIDASVANTDCAEGKVHLQAPAGEVSCLSWDARLPLQIPGFTLINGGRSLLLLVPPERRARVPALSLRSPPDLTRARALRDESARPAKSLVRRLTRALLTRESILLPAGATLRLPLRVPRGSSLVFGAALDRLDTSPDQGSLSLRVSVRAEGEPRVLLETQIAAGPWQEQRIKLEHYAGKEVELTLEALYSGVGDPLVTLALAEPAVRMPPGEASRDASRDRPSVLLVVVDCLRADSLGVYGSKRGATPFMDGLAAQGLRFESAFATASWTVPAVTSLLSGLQPARHGANLTGLGSLPPGLPLLAPPLRNAGWTSFAGVANPSEVGVGRGFSEGYQRFWERQSAPAGEVVDAYLAWLQSLDPREPTFAWLHLLDPHMPYLAPEPDRRRFLAEGEPLMDPDEAFRWLRRSYMGELQPDAPESVLALQTLRAQYDAEVRYVDRELERLFQTLDVLGRSRDLLVVLTSDHGESFGEHGLMGHGLHVWREQVHVPLIVTGPGVPVRDVEVPVSAASVAPSILGHLGQEIPEGLAPNLGFGAGGELRFETRWIPSETRAFRFPVQEWKEGVISMRSASLTCLYNPMSGETRVSEPVRDPKELIWSGDPRPELVTDCREEAAALWASEPYMGIRWAGIDPLRIAQLQALGYLMP